MTCKSKVDIIHNYLAVVAIDIGSTHSGYAFQFRGDAKKSLTEQIQCCRWNNAMASSVKTSTSLLLNPDGSLNSFGFDAETKFADMHKSYGTFQDPQFPNKTASDWYFFRHFKMKLYNQEILRGTMKIKDELEKIFPMKQVFSKSISYLKHHAQDNMKRGAEIEPEDIFWVLTVPAIWSEPAKQFMRKAAVEAGIPEKSLTLALEPEAAALYCRELGFLCVGKGKDKDIVPFTPGKNFMVVDLGGGTGDITIHEVQPDGTLHEKHMATGGNWGGGRVNEEFELIWKNILGEKEYASIKKNYPQEILEFYQSFELIKRRIGEDLYYKSVSLPECIKEIEDLNSKVCRFSKEHYSDEEAIKIKRGKAEFRRGILENLFHNTTEEIIGHLKDLTRIHSNLDAILLVGGFSESKIVFKQIQDCFPSMKIFCPPDGSLSVLKGAVIYGYRPMDISRRISRYSYGFSQSIPFDEHKHNNPQDLAHRYNDRLEDVFKPIILAGEPMIPGDKRKCKCRPRVVVNKMATIEFYGTRNTDPKYVRDPENIDIPFPCYNIGDILVQVVDDNYSKGDEINVTVEFGYTELKVTAKVGGDNGFIANASFGLLK